MSDLTDFLVRVINLAFEIYFWLIILRVIISWIPPLKSRLYYSFAEFVYELTEPFLGFIRRYVPVIGAGGVGIDLSPFIAIILLQIIQRAVITLIYMLM